MATTSSAGKLSESELMGDSSEIEDVISAKSTGISFVF